MNNSAESPRPDLITNQSEDDTWLRDLIGSSYNPSRLRGFFQTSPEEREKAIGKLQEKLLEALKDNNDVKSAEAKVIKEWMEEYSDK